MTPYVVDASVIIKWFVDEVHKASLIYRLQEMYDRTLANPAPVLDPFRDRFAKVKSDQDARDAVLVCGLRKTGERA